MSEKDRQSYKYLLTINNPVDKGYTHDAIKHILVENFKTVDYFCMADEQGSTHHTHIFAFFTSRVRFSTIKKHFPEAHIDIVKGLSSDNIQYVSKTGKWKDSDKSETKIEGTFEEWGNRPPDSVGKKWEMTLLYNMIADGMTNSEILAMNQDYIMQIDKLDKLRTMLLTERYKDTIRSDLRVIYVSGDTGTGKTSGILKKHNPSNVYRVTDYTHPFDGYNNQPVLCFDEFRNSLRLKEMLNYCDIYPIELPARFSNKFACFSTVYIVSNWKLERQFEDAQKYDHESWQAFLRRIHEVHIYKDKGKIIEYHSVEEYLNREKDFRPISEFEQAGLPF